jgi:hypothetical protein
MTLTPQEIAERLGCDDLKVGESRKVCAPYRDDVNPSLNVTRKKDTFLFKDHGYDGNTYQALVEHFSSNGHPPLDVRTTFVRRESVEDDASDDGALDWFARKTRLPRSFLESLPLYEERDRTIVFTFTPLKAEKLRSPKVKGTWRNHAVVPPLWPMPPDVLPEEIVLAEGESDACTLRYCGYDAFAVTRGASADLALEVFVTLRERGVRRIVFVGDADDAGRGWAARQAQLAHLAGLDAAIVDLPALTSPLGSDVKDANDLWRSCKSKAKFRKAIEQSTVGLDRQDYVESLADVLAWAHDDEEWLIEGLVARGTKTLVSAPAKSLKTYFVLHVVAACATCSDLLGVPLYRVPRPLRVLLIEEEGSRPMFGRRVRRVLNGMPGDVQGAPEFHFRRGFNLLDPAQVDAIVRYAREAQIDVLIFDPLQRITPGVDENSNSDMRRVWDPLNRILVELPHLACIVVHHTRKGDSLSPEASRGAGSMLGEYDLGIFLKKNDDFTRTEDRYTGTLALTFDGRELPQEYTKDGGAMEVEYTFDYARDAFTMRATGDVVHVNVRTRTSQIPEFLSAYLHNAQDFVTTSDLYDEAQRRGLDVSSRETILKHLRALEREGRVVADVRPEFHGAKAWKWVTT